MMRQAADQGETEAARTLLVGVLSHAYSGELAAACKPAA